MAAEVHFLLNGEARALRGPPPNQTVLEYLRTVEHVTGTKEGCAEGDCGACTVVLGELVGAHVRYRAINSCIALVGQLDGKLLLTVEGLADPDGTLHPVQQALVELHGSQCGFCTPGFVMAMFAWHHSGEASDDETIHDMLAGNLCRCTGYRSIVEACRRVGGVANDRFTRDEATIAARLAALAGRGRVEATRDGRRLYVPRTLEELTHVLARDPEAEMVAGGTDQGLVVTKQHVKMDAVVSLGGIDELKAVTVDDDTVTFGAAVTYADALAVLDRDYPSFATLVRRIGSRQIRNLGTICGNIANASPIGDTPPPLLAIGAEVDLVGAGGRRTVDLDDFFLDYRKTARRPGEVLAAVRFRRPGPKTLFRTYKISKRYDQDISAVCGAYRLEIDNGRILSARVAYGGMAATPKRAPACEAALAGQAWSEATLERAAAALSADFTPMTDFRGTADYRARVAANLLRRLWLDAGSKTVPVEVMAL